MPPMEALTFLCNLSFQILNLKMNKALMISMTKLLWHNSNIIQKSSMPRDLNWIAL